MSNKNKLKDFSECYTEDVTYYDNNLEIPYNIIPLLSKEERERVWTMVDVGDDILVIVGIHFVNRIGYIMTKEVPAKEHIEEEFHCFRCTDELYEELKERSI